MINKENFDAIKSYFNGKAIVFGPEPKGSDWNSVNAQDLRITRLLQGFETNNLESLGDVGCGFGRALTLLRDLNFDFIYSGYEIALEPYRIATVIYPESTFYLIESLDEIGKHDRFILSGVFNLKLEEDSKTWEQYIFSSLATLMQKAECGIALNFLSLYSNPELRNDSLFYADPLRIFDFSKRYLSPHVKLDHSYGMWDFTIHILKGD